jgi:Dolichyl-phosphate-mannose-protein mannosyltransferase
LKQSWLELALVFVTLAAISGAASAYVAHSGWTLYYGDAEAHLNIARRIVDSRLPGYKQIGTVWLPLPHLLMLPLVRNNQLWRTGLAGVIPSSLCFVCGGLFLYASIKRAAGSSAAAVASLGILALNPNLLYLQATPMTEAVLLAAFMALLYFTVRFRQTQSLGAVIGAGVASIAASLSRYEGWFLIPFVAIYFLVAARKNRVVAALLFSVIAVLGPLYWLGHNWWLYSNAIEFYNGPYSAMAIYRRALTRNMAHYPGDHDWKTAWLYYRTAVLLCARWAAVIIAAAGLVGVVRRRVFWPLLLAVLLPPFYIWSMHSGGTPIFVPTLWPHTSYNTRYALSALPLLSIAGGCLVLVASERWRPWLAAVILIAAAAPWLIRPRPDDWVTWKESRANSAARRTWTQSAAPILATSYRTGAGIITSFGDLIGILRTAGIPLREALYNDDEPAWMSAIARPGLFLREEWAVTVSGDAVATAIQKASFKNGPRYHLVQTFQVKGAPVIEIYKRD